MKKVSYDSSEIIFQAISIDYMIWKVPYDEINIIWNEKMQYVPKHIIISHLKDFSGFRQNQRFHYYSTQL